MTASSNLTVHASKESRIALMAAHGDTDAALAARIRAVAAALASGTDVKTLAADMLADELAGVTDADGNPVTAVTAGILGYARGVLTTLDKLAIKLPRTGFAAPLAMSYRAIKRHGVKTTPAKLASEASQGESMQDKLAILTDAATKLNRAPKATPADKGEGKGKGEGDKGEGDKLPSDEPVRTVTAPVSADELAKLMSVAAASIAAGRIVPDAKTLTAIESLMAECKRALAGKATPAALAGKGSK